MKLSEKLQLKGTELYVNGLSAVEKLVHGVTLNPFSRDLWQDPYAYHNRMRETRPIHYSLALRAYWVTRFDWVQEILRDKRFGADVRKYDKRVKQITRNMDEERLHNFNNPSMLDLDPPDHSRVRRLVAQGFIVRTRADADTFDARPPVDTTRRDAALESGAQFVSTDYPDLETNPFGTDYFVEIPDGMPGRCNPINSPPGCRNPALEVAD